jgi:type IV pilus assembly protein PilY1
VSRNPIDWSTKRGWYINLPNSGQRVIYPTETLKGKIIAVDTMSPVTTISADPCVQTARGKAWNYVIDGLTGNGPVANIFDTNGNSIVEMTDVLVSGYENTTDGRTRYIKNDTKSTSSTTVFTPLSTQLLPETAISCAVLGNCAFVKHTWRQLFLR